MSETAERGMIYGGDWRPALSGETFASIDPADGSELGRVPQGGAADASAAVGAAQAAFPAWSGLSAAARAKHLHRFAQVLDSRRDDLARLITREEGKPLAESHIELNLTIDSFAWYAEEARRSYGDWIPDPLPGRRLITLRQPVGVCAGIIPWNVPAAMIARKAGPALAAGCTMVMKPAEQTPLTALAIGAAALEAELPPGVFNVVTGDPQAIGKVFLEDARVRKISFTGSTEVGRLLLRGAAEQIKRTSMELGGNAPVILFADCDLDTAVFALSMLKFLNAGQACISANRIYVERPILEAVAERLTERAQGLKLGNGLDAGVTMGPLIEAGAVQKVERLVADALERGAIPLTGGKRRSGGDYAKGFFFEPTVLSGVTPEMAVVNEEVFGPVASLLPFDGEEEVIAAANNVPQGLAAYLFTGDLGRGIRVGERLETGMVGLNEVRIGATEAPFGGVKQSGIGREGGREGLDEYLETKLMAIGVGG
ncbi:MAG: NAD-dependent succinate-semialdehyde dehydrogenase [Rhodovibrionaceae bacterium]